MPTTKKNLEELPTAEEVLKQKREFTKRIREEAQQEKGWNDRMTKALVGKKIASVRYMTSEETKESGWSKSPLMIKLSDGTVIIPLQDDEGNDGGSLEFFHHTKKIEEEGAPVMLRY